MAADAMSIELMDLGADYNGGRKPRAEEIAREEEKLRNTLEDTPNSRRARLELAKFLFHQNRFEEAIEYCESVLDIDSKNANAFCLLGRIHGFGKPQDAQLAEQYFQKALASDDEYAKAHYFYAYLLRSRLDRFDEAEKHYKIAMKLRPDDVTSYNDCAIMLVRQDRCVEAKELYEKVLELEPNHSIAHFNLANLLRKDLKDYQKAEEHFLISIEKRPKFTAALNNYATMLHHQLNQYKKAETFYLRAINIDSKYARAHFNYANLCREHLKKYESAQRHYLQAIQFDSQNPNFYNNYGLLLQYGLKQYKNAKKQYEIALRLDDGHALGHCNYATILMQMVDKKYNHKFDSDYESSSDDNNSDENEIKIITNNRHLSSKIDSNDDNDSNGKKKNTSKNGNRTNNKSSANSGRKGKHLKQMTKEERHNRKEAKRKAYLSKSESHFKRSIELNDSLVMAYNNYGCLLRRLERFDEAKVMFEKALKIDPKFSMAKRNLEKANKREKPGMDSEPEKKYDSNPSSSNNNKNKNKNKNKNYDRNGKNNNKNENNNSNNTFGNDENGLRNPNGTSKTKNSGKSGKKDDCLIM